LIISVAGHQPCRIAPAPSKSWLKASPYPTDRVCPDASGYFADSATLWALQEYAAEKEWHPSVQAEWLNLSQMIFLAFGMMVFLLAFLFYSRIFAASLIKASSHATSSGGGGGHG